MNLLQLLADPGPAFAGEARWQGLIAPLFAILQDRRMLSAEELRRRLECIAHHGLSCLAGHECA
jgi:hypothetical protein